jgi:hypothetical protein
MEHGAFGNNFKAMLATVQMRASSKFYFGAQSTDGFSSMEWNLRSSL